MAYAGRLLRNLHGSAGIQLSVMVTELPTLGYVWRGGIQTSTLPGEFAPEQKVTLTRGHSHGDLFIIQ